MRRRKPPANLQCARLPLDHAVIPHARSGDDSFGFREKGNEVPTNHGYIRIPSTTSGAGEFHVLARSGAPGQAHNVETRLDSDDSFEHDISKFNRSNDYGSERMHQKHATMTAIEDINTQDFALQECMGTIVDRTKERLGTTTP